MKDAHSLPSAFLAAGDGDIGELDALTRRTLDPGALAFAAAASNNVPLYDVAALRPALKEDRQSLMSEWAWVLGKGPGILVLQGAYGDTAPIDAATAMYHDIIAREKAASSGKGDHFAASGANDRIWNSLQKLCLAAPDTFADYFGNDAISAVCEAWLGPFYQMTAQVNLVRPGGKAQTAHCDYHLGFMSENTTARFPRHAYPVSAALTLQGAIAHCDMPLESGPTKLLPYSHLFEAGYVAYRHDDARALFDDRHIQLPLAKGDALFFNPSLFHAAGENRSRDVQRMANLLQVGSAMGRTLEAIDRVSMCAALYPAMQSLDLPEARRDAAIAACAEGYPFPTNLDSDPPIGGMVPESQAALMKRALAEGMSSSDFTAALAAQAKRRLP